MKRIFVFLPLLVLLLTSCVTREQYNNLERQRDSLIYVLYQEQILTYKLQKYAESLYYNKVEPRTKVETTTPLPPAIQLNIDSIKLPAEIRKAIGPEEKTLSDLNPEPEVPVSQLRVAQPEITSRTEGNRVVYTLSNSILFTPGTTKLSESGTSLLMKFGKQLAEQKDYLITVEGHTDNINISRMEGISDNWDLSVKRATEVVRALIAAGVSPVRLVAAGRSKFEPVASNQEETSREQNRRIEIIVTPMP
ncbi:MAG: OmpA family protein [Bacteroidia bacterium]|nr:OmpA family protein [Bacteroidia bacterium]